MFFQMGFTRPKFIIEFSYFKEDLILIWFYFIFDFFVTRVTFNAGL